MFVDGKSSLDVDQFPHAMQVDPSPHITGHMAAPSYVTNVDFVIPVVVENVRNW